MCCPNVCSADFIEDFLLIDTVFKSAVSAVSAFGNAASEISHHCDVHCALLRQPASSQSRKQLCVCVCHTTCHIISLKRSYSLSLRGLAAMLFVYFLVVLCIGLVLLVHCHCCHFNNIVLLII